MHIHIMSIVAVSTPLYLIMRTEATPSDKEPAKRSLRTTFKMHLSWWVILGYIFWVGFLIGAIIMHSVAR